MQRITHFSRESALLLTFVCNLQRGKPGKVCYRLQARAGPGPDERRTRSTLLSPGLGRRPGTDPRINVCRPYPFRAGDDLARLTYTEVWVTLTQAHLLKKRPVSSTMCATFAGTKPRDFPRITWRVAPTLASHPIPVTLRPAGRSLYKVLITSYIRFFLDPRGDKEKYLNRWLSIN